MQDARFDKLASLLVDYSTTLKRNEKVLIESFDAPEEMTIALIRAARKAGAVPFVQIQRARVSRELALGIDAEPSKQVPVGRIGTPIGKRVFLGEPAGVENTPTLPYASTLCGASTTGPFAPLDRT